MQISEIVLYGHHGQVRSIPLRLGQLNIITGPSLRGKSQIIEIIDYCFGRGRPNLAPGPVRDKVAWFGLRLVTAKGEVFVARRAPVPPKRSSEQVFISTGSKVKIPSFNALSQTANTDGLIKELSGILGINTNQTDPSEFSTREPFAATIRHAILLCLQTQNEISNPAILFHRQGDDGGTVGRDFLATLPFFLGAVPEKRISVNAALSQARRDRRIAERRFGEEQRIAQDQTSRAKLLINDAIDVGIFEPSANEGTLADLMSRLRLARNWHPQQRSDSSTGGDAFQVTLREREALVEQARFLKREIEDAKTVEAEQGGYLVELREQRARLDSIGLYEHAQELNLPLHPSILKELAALDLELSDAKRPSSQLGEFIQRRIASRNEVLARLRQVDDTITSLSQQNLELQRLREADVRCAFVVGKISLFLDSVNQIEAGSRYALRLREAQNREQSLEAEFSQSDFEPRMRVALESVGRSITDWSKLLSHEYANTTWMLDERVGTVKTVGPRGVVSMSEMGGGKNHLGCHLYVHFALHKWFRENARPVPGFLFLDRPTIGFYENPLGVDDPRMRQLRATDQSYVRSLFNWMADVVRSLNGQLQVIVTEHVDLADQPGFREALVGNWWQSGESLVPNDWLAGSSSPLEE